jgi:uncharacterized repeat protein (TIGR01451 family)/LPXTG-motif cell wall-anchored protein
LTIDTSMLDPTKLDVFPLTDAGCKAGSRPGVFICPVPDLPAGGNYNGFNLNRPEMVVVRSIGDSGDAGRFTVSVTSKTPDPNQANNTATTRVTVANSGIDMVAWAKDVYTGVQGKKPIQPGGTGQLLWMLWNTGNNPIQGVEYTVVLPPYLTFDPVSRRPECRYELGYTVAHCVEDGKDENGNDVVVAAGDYFTTTKSDGSRMPEPIVVRLAANAPGPVALTDGVVTGHGLKELSAEQLPPMTGLNVASRPAGVLSAAEATQVKNSVGSGNDAPADPDADPNDNSAPFSVFTAANPADLSISAAPVTGHVGDTVNVQVTVRNAGPADAFKTKVTVTAPEGTEFVSADQACTATTAGKVYTCDLDTEKKTETTSEILGLKIVSATVADGKAEVSSAISDPNAADNTTPITVTVLEGSPSPGAEPSAPTAGGTGGGLPVTGSQAGLISVLGVGMAAAGGVLMVLARRRRAVIVAPID